MTFASKTITTVQEAHDLDWEVPGLEWNIDRPESENYESIISGFEAYNHVVLEGDALDYFRSAAEDYYFA